MASAQLAVDPRIVTGKKVRSLRHKGIIPAHLYGHGIESLALQTPLSAIGSLLRTMERNTIIDLQINGENATRPVMLRGIQRNPVTDELVHIDFFQISLTERLRADVLVRLIGEAPAVQVFGGILLQSLDRVTVEALPSEIPGHLDADVSGLETLESAIHVRDLAIPANVLLITDPDQVVAKVSPPRVEAEPEAAAAVPAEGEAVAATEGAEPGAEPAAAPAEEKS
jgi:large subunit ribosomal protein L25